MGKKPTVAQFVTMAIEASGKTNAEVAEALGYPADRANMISMIRTGRSKLPVNKVAALAKVVGIDAAHLLRVVLGEYSPETLSAIEEALGGHVLSEGEQEVVSLMRKEAGGLPVRFEDTQLVTIQGWAREATKALAKEQARLLKQGSERVRSDKSRELAATPRMRTA